MLLSLSARSSKLAGVLSLNDAQHACPISGFLPLHCVVANGHCAMYDFLVELPGMADDLRASETSPCTAAGQHPHMTPLQLACQMGNHEMLRHILGRRSELVYRWGHVAQYKMGLDGIDSTGSSGSDVMELIGRLDASKRTREMLLDSFLQGFLFALFQSKWRRFGRTAHLVLRAMELAFIVALGALSLWLKESPAECTRARWLPALVLALAVPMAEEDLRSLVVYSSSARRSFVHSSRFAAVQHVLAWAHSHMLLNKLLGCALGCLGALILLAGDSDDAGDAGAVEESESLVDAVLVPPSPAGEAFFSPWFPMWSVLAVALLLLLQAFFAAVLIPAPRLGVFFHTSLKMVMHDISTFVALFLIFFCTYGFSMYVAYPRVGERTLQYAPNFNTMAGAVHELVAVAVTGEPIKISLLEGSPVSHAGWIELMAHASIGAPLSVQSPMTGVESIEMSCFIAFYVAYVLLTLVLLLNLLIASMNSTFVTTSHEAALEYRVLYARNLLRLELLAQPFAAPPCHLCNTNGGEREGDLWYFFTKVFDDVGDVEGGEGGEGGEGSQATYAHLDALSRVIGLTCSGGVDEAATTIQNLFRKRRGSRHVRVWSTEGAINLPARESSRSADTVRPPSQLSCKDETPPKTMPDSRARSTTPAQTRARIKLASDDQYSHTAVNGGVEGLDA